MMIIEQCLIFGRPCHKTDIEQREQCFIIMDYKGAHSSSIKDVLQISVQKAFSLKPVLASEVKLPWSKDMFCDKICEPIRSSKLSIADITYNNTNVGFEIGISQMMGVPVIITFHKEWREQTIGGKIDFSIIPADFAGRYVVPYSNHEDLTQKLKNFDIEKKVEEIRVSRSKKHEWSYDPLIEKLPEIEIYCAGVDFPHFKKAIELSNRIRKLRENGNLVSPDIWYDLYKSLDWGAYQAKIRIEFVNELKEYLDLLNKNYGYNYRLRKK